MPFDVDHSNLAYREAVSRDCGGKLLFLFGECGLMNLLLGTTCWALSVVTGDDPESGTASLAPGRPRGVVKLCTRSSDHFSGNIQRS
jgi:hypothetical protein